MAEVNQVPEIAVSPELGANTPRISTDPPTQTFLRAPNAADDAYRDSPKGRVAEWMRSLGLNPDFEVPFLGRPLAPTEGDIRYYNDPIADHSALGKLSHAYYDTVGIRPDDPLAMQLLAPLAFAAESPATPTGAGRKMGVHGAEAVGKLIAKNIPRNARALATYANDLSRAAAALGKADLAATPKAAAMLRKGMYRATPGERGALGAWFFGGTPSDAKTLNMAYTKVMGGKSPMTDAVAKPIVEAADGLSAELTAALKAYRGGIPVDKAKLKAAVLKVSSEVKAGAEAYSSRGAWNAVKDAEAWRWIGGKLASGAEIAAGVRRYKAGSLEAKRSWVGALGTAADWTLAHVPGMSPAALELSQKYIGGAFGAAPLATVAAAAGYSAYDHATKPSRNEAGAAAGDAAAAEAYRRAFGTEPPKAAAPAAPVAPVPQPSREDQLEAAFYF